MLEYGSRYDREMSKLAKSREREREKKERESINIFIGIILKDNFEKKHYIKR